MKCSVIACAAVIVSAATALAPAQATDQFYANDEGAYAWTTNSKSNLRTTTWFCKNPPDSAAYQQITAVIYDAKPHEVLYLDKVNKRVVGRLDLNTEQFSLLPPATQKQRQAIDKFEFPAAGKLPRAEQMFEPLSGDAEGNRHTLALPPPTLQFPRLENSVWDTSYLSADKFLIRSELTLDGAQGAYRLTDKPGTGRLSDVTYEREGDEHVIRGNWNLGRSAGTFKFNVPPSNLNVFWGEFSFQEGRTVGAWDGVRKPRPTLKATEKPVR